MSLCAHRPKPLPHVSIGHITAKRPRRSVERMKAENKYLHAAERRGWIGSRRECGRSGKPKPHGAEAKRWAALTPQQRLVEEHEEIRARALRAIEALRERFAKTGSLLG
jgi:hypothetical protein